MSDDRSNPIVQEGDVPERQGAGGSGTHRDIKMLLAPLTITANVTLASAVMGGMPALLPTPYTAESGRRSPGDYGGYYSASYPRWDAISFFLGVFFLSAWAVQGLWRSLQQIWPRLPRLTYARAVSLVLLWGLGFAVVLTMISGARELMTPGAWRKQGWTYRLADAANSQETPANQDLEEIRQWLWQYAALHEGAFPPADDPELNQRLETLKNWPGLRWIYVAGKKAEWQGRPLVFEPSISDTHRRVLLTSGMIGTMRTDDLQAAVGEEPR